MVKVSKHVLLQIQMTNHVNMPDMPCVMVPGLGEEEAAELDRKLQLLDSVLEKEVGELPVVPYSLSPRPCTMPHEVLE